jgi:hypothetical protein
MTRHFLPGGRICCAILKPFDTSGGISGCGTAARSYNKNETRWPYSGVSMLRRDIKQQFWTEGSPAW